MASRPGGETGLKMPHKTGNAGRSVRKWGADLGNCQIDNQKGFLIKL